MQRRDILHFLQLPHLGSGAHLKCPKDHIHYPLGCEDIPSYHSCILGRLKDGARRNKDFDRRKAPLKVETLGELL